MIRSRSHIKNRIKRALSRLKHRRGHGVHSPYVYSIVREVFMSRERRLVTASPLYEKLLAEGVKSREAMEIERLRHHCGLSTFCFDSLDEVDMVICTTRISQHTTEEILCKATSQGATVVILSPQHSPQREDMCERVISLHHSTTLLRLRYLVIFNNHLPKQHFIL